MRFVEGATLSLIEILLVIFCHS